MMTKYVFDPEISEEEWLDLDHVEGAHLWSVWGAMPYPEDRRAPDRRRLLLVGHLMRQIADQLTDPRCLAVIEAGEKYADGLISNGEMRRVHDEACKAYDATSKPNEAARDAVNAAGRYLYDQGETAEILVGAAGSRAAQQVGNRGPAADAADREASLAMRSLILHLIHEVHGNPFRPVAFSPAWRTDTALSLAQQMYESRDFSPMPILADALQDAGCDTAAVLDHCRDTSRTHIRGCWVVDLVLGQS